MMKKNKVLMLAGTIAVSGVVLLNGDVSVAADTIGGTTVKTAATSNYQNGTYTATATLYKSGTDVSSMMSSMVNSQADVTIKNQTATITLTFGKLSNANMVKSLVIDGVEATHNGQTFTVAIPVVDLSKTLQSTIHIETVIGSVPFSETQPVDLTVKDLKLVARDPDEVAAEQAAAEKAAAEKAAADKAAADKAAADKAAADKAAADKAAADKAAADKAAADKAAADKATADKATADKAAAEKAKQAAKAKAEQEATKKSQNGTYTATPKLYKSGTTDYSMMASMVSPTAYIVIKDGQATITLTFGELSNANMVKSWVIDGVSAVKSGQSFVIVLPTSELGKTLKSTIHVETMIGTLPFTETQPVDLKLKDLERIPSGSMPDNPSNPRNLPNNYVSPNQATGHDVPLTAQLSSTSKLPNTATNETTTAPLLAALVSGVLALGIWLKKVLR
ncbi:NEAT domain-containing protein [Leuconostoc falkenbergense]|jgi:heme-binding NEAT domain protein|uniref:NEAT domain-containing protein n=2 Tax=Leuconostoc falkenbergense TaxID=2766470 RepID=UPI0021A9B0EA|nr:NEAT domain-containing protein [Leuconostoc falkenbergense]